MSPFLFDGGGKFFLSIFLLFVFLNDVAAQNSKDGMSKVQDPLLEELLELDIEELSVTVASKREEAISKAPGVITMITAEEIQSFGANSLADIIYRLPNTYRNNVSLLLDNASSIRGFQRATDNKVLILLNGRPMRDGFSGGHNMSIYRSMPLEFIERIEVVRGPGSVLYGTNAISGVINIISKDIEEFHQDEITGGYGIDNTAQASGLYSKQIGDIKFMLSGKLFDSDGWDYLINDSNGNTLSTDLDQKNIGFAGIAKYKNWSLMGFSGYKKGAAIRSNQPSFSVSEEKLRRDFADLQYQRDLNQSWKTTLNATYNGFHFTDNVGLDSAFSDLFLESSVEGTVWKNINIVSGFIYQRLNGSLINGTIPYTNDRFNFYTQADYEPWDFLKLIGGFQVSKPEGIDANITPRFGAIVHSENQVGLKLLYGESFRSPFAAEQALNRPNIKGNPNLNPEMAKTFNAQLFYNTPKIYTALTYYTSQLNDIVQLAPEGGGIFRFQNVSDFDFEGVEFEWKAFTFPGWEFTGSASYQVNEDQTGVPDVGVIPNTMVKTGLSYQSPKGYSLGLFNSYFGDAAKLDAPQLNPNADSYNWVSLKGMLDIPKFLERPDIPNITLNLFVDNLLDEDVFAPEFVFRRVNTGPLRRGIGVFGSATLKF